jgi:hypothetical protein
MNLKLITLASLALWLAACSGSQAAGAGHIANAGSAGVASGGNGAAGAGVTGEGGGSAGTMSAGMTSSGGSAPSGGSAGSAGNGGSVGGQVGASGGGGVNAGPSIDFSIWSLQLPTGSGTSPTAISPSQLLAGYSDTYFYLAPDGGQAFMDPATGITTSGSQHCRTEMREDKPGGAPAAWVASGTNSLTVTGKVIQVGGGASGRVTVAQVFNATDSIPLCELEYSSSVQGFQLLYEEAKGQGGSPIDLNTPVALNTTYSFTLSLSQGKLTVTINGQPVYARMPSATTLAKSFYFKFGNYDQTTTAGSISTTPYTIVEVASAAVVHQ